MKEDDDIKAAAGELTNSQEDGSLSAERLQALDPASSEDLYADLIALLRAAAVIEHSFVAQYLYAAFSIKPLYRGLRGDNGSLGESADLLGVAIQEMQHWHINNLLLRALGALPNLYHKDFPFQVDIYPFPFDLLGLNQDTLARYVYAEAKALQDATPEDREFLEGLRQAFDPQQEIEHVGSVYAKIIAFVEKLISEPPPAPRLSAEAMRMWLNQLKKIKQNGEDDHYHFFKDVFFGTHPIFKDVFLRLQIALPSPGEFNIWDDPDLAIYPSFAVPENPPTDGCGISNETIRKIAQLGNLHYRIILGLLDMSYQSDDWRMPFVKTLPRPFMELAQRHMRDPLIRIGRYLAEQQAGLSFNVPSADFSAGTVRREHVAGLVSEAEKLALDIKRENLPNGFKTSIYSITLNGLSHLPGRFDAPST